MAFNKKKENIQPAKKKKWDLFISEYFSNGFNGTQAALKAGYTKKAAKDTAYALLHYNAYVKEKIKETAKQLLDKREITGVKILEELEKLAFSNIADHVEIEEYKNDKGEKRYSLKFKENADMSVIKNITVDATGKMRAELFSKEKALEMLMKYAQLAKEHEITLKLEGLKDISINFSGK